MNNILKWRRRGKIFFDLKKINYVLN